MKNIRTYRDSTKLIFKTDLPALPKLSETERGDVFLREGMVCMRVELGKIDCLTSTPGRFAIINLQTGRVWEAEDCTIAYVEATVTLAGQETLS